jgi:hypothetical protein
MDAADDAQIVTKPPAADDYIYATALAARGRNVLMLPTDVADDTSVARAWLSVVKETAPSATLRWSLAESLTHRCGQAAGHDKCPTAAVRAPAGRVQRSGTQSKPITILPSGPIRVPRGNRSWSILVDALSRVVTAE